MFSPVYGLIFLFPYYKGQRPVESSNGTVLPDGRSIGLFFAQQVSFGKLVHLKLKLYSYSSALKVIQNACATQAILNCLMNVKDPTVHLGTTLEEFKTFTDGFDSAVCSFLQRIVMQI